MYAAKVILDSVSPMGTRLITMEWTYPRIVLAEVNTHKMVDKNTSSSRAVPFAKKLAAIQANPFIPDRFPLNGPGMQPCAYMDESAGLIIVSLEDFDKKYGGKEVPSYIECRDSWLDARDAAILEAEKLNNLGVHKEIVNRLLEPWEWTTSVLTATEWSNMWAQRCHPAAQWQFQKVAKLAWQAMQDSKPVFVDYGRWHLPYLDDDDRKALTDERQRKVSAARCAAVSFHRQGEKREYDVLENVFSRLVGGADGKQPGHWSPLGHVARPLDVGDRCRVDAIITRLSGTRYVVDSAASQPSGHTTEFFADAAWGANLRGFHQLRKDFLWENFEVDPAWVRA